MAKQNRIAVDLEKIAHLVNGFIPVLCAVFALLGHFVSFYFHFLTVAFVLLAGLNFFFLHIQKKHALLSNFGLIAQLRYMLESVGPEFRQYLYSSDTEEKPFSRVERSEIYQKAKGIDSSSAFGSQLAFDEYEIKLRHSMFPKNKKDIPPYELVLGEERGINSQFTLRKSIMISAMSYGSLGRNAIRALARGARQAGIVMNTGEGGFPKYHLMEKCDLMFQMGTAKFGVRNEEATLNEAKLEALANQEHIKMIEIKLSQGAKPGKGGLLPKEKITEEIAELRGVPMGQDVVSPPYHLECVDLPSTIKFIRSVQDVSKLPTGIKFSFGRPEEFRALLKEMKKQKVYPDFLSVDGAEGGTGAAPKSFMDDVGVPLFHALPEVNRILNEEKVRDQFKLFCAGKLINPGKQFIAFSMGADAVYTARGFMLAIGCIQALQCNKNSCPVGITTHLGHLQSGLDIDDKARRVVNYVRSLEHDHVEMLAAMGEVSVRDLAFDNIYWEGKY